MQGTGKILYFWVMPVCREIRTKDCLFSWIYTGNQMKLFAIFTLIDGYTANPDEKSILLF